jgi:hypothetical protein
LKIVRFIIRKLSHDSEHQSVFDMVPESFDRLGTSRAPRHCDVLPPENDNFYTVFLRGGGKFVMCVFVCVFLGAAGKDDSLFFYRFSLLSVRKTINL